MCSLNILMRVFSFVLITLLFASCVKTHYFTIETLEPAEISVTQDVQKIGIVDLNNLVNKNPDDIYFFTDTTETDSIHEIELAAKLTAEFTAEYLTNSPRFKPEYIENKTKDVKSEISIEHLNKLCEENSVDGLVVIESFFYKTNENIEVTMLFESLPIYSTGIQVKRNAEVKVYSMSDNSFIKNFSLTDTSYYDHTWLSESAAENFFPESYELVEKVATITAKEICAKIAPSWHTTNRFVYYGKKKWLNAIKLVKDDKWISAAAKWNKQTNSKKKKLAAYSCFNMAIAAEMEGNLNAALAWAEKSYDYRRNYLTAKYIKIIRKRLEKEKLIIEQMEGG